MKDFDYEAIANLACPFTVDLLETAPALTPNQFNCLLVAINASIAAKLPLDYFKAMMKPSRPCGNPGCECHVTADAFNALLQRLRALAE